MRGFSIILLLLIPAFIALGHDIYLFYENIVTQKGFSVGLVLEEFKFSALGFIWTTYEVESYKTIVASTAPEDWATIDFILTFKAFFVGLGFAGSFIALFMILKLFGKGPFSGESTKSKGSVKTKEVSFRAGASKKKMNYSRK